MMASLKIVLTVGFILVASLRTKAATNEYLFLGHLRDDGPGEIVQREVERVDFSKFNLLLLGGDYTWQGTGTRATVDYLNAFLHLDATSTLAALGNHDTSHKSYFTDVTGRPRYYAFETNHITFVVLDTTDDGQNIVGDELQMLRDTVDGLSNSTHLVMIHHHLIWLSDYPPLADLKGSPLIGASSANLSGLNFYSDVYPLLLQARAKGVDVLCLAGDRTGSETEEFYVDHTTADGVRFVAAGLMEELPPEHRLAVVLEHNLETDTLTCRFTHLTDLPRIPDEPLVIDEIHYHPAAGQGEDHAFVELFNRGSAPYDLSGASFTSGIAFTFPDTTLISPGEFVLLAANTNVYTGLGAQVFGYESGNLANASEPIWLRNRKGLEIDYVNFGSSDPWPVAPNGSGSSLMLIDPARDNSLEANWAASDQPGGTPAEVNIVRPSAGPLLISEGNATTQWNGVVPGASYRLDFTDELDPPNWQPASAPVEATNSSIDLVDPESTARVQRYFRITRVFH